MAHLPGFLIDTSNVVLVSPAINPPMVTPEFLLTNKIVQKSWKLQEQIVLPPLVNLMYTNGVLIKVEEGRVQIDESAEKDAFRNTYQISTIAKKLIQHLGSIEYSAIGMNFKIFYPTENAGKLIVNKFISSGKWRKKVPELIHANARLSFQLENAVLNISLSPKIIRHKESLESKSVVSIDCNFHFQGPHKRTKCDEILGQWPTRQAKLTEIVKSLFER